MDCATTPLNDLGDAPHVCVNCDKPATQSCSACRGSPNSEGGLVGPTWYCSSECQKINRPAHKDICKRREVRKILYRAGSTVEAAFEKYREELFDKSIKAIERNGKNVMLVDGYYNTKDCIFPFSLALFPDEGEKRAVLMYLTCEDAYASMHNTIKMLLKGKHCIQDDEAFARGSRITSVSDLEQESARSSKKSSLKTRTGPSI